MAKRKLARRLRDAVKAFQKEDSPQMGELAWADPMHLIAREQFVQFNPDVLVTRKGLNTYDKMRDDDQIKAAMTFKKHAVLATGWTVESPEGQDEDWEVRRFVEDQLMRMPGTLETKILEILTAMEYGFSITEKVYTEIEDGEWAGKIGFENIKTKKPHFFGFNVDRFGDIRKISQVSLPGAGPPIAEFDVEKFIVYAYAKEFQNPYGNSDLRAAYRHWWAKDHALKWLNMLLERFGIPPLFGMYDPDEISGQALDDLKTIFQRMQAATNVLIPAINGPDGKAFELEFPEVATNVQRAFDPALKMFDTSIARSLLMPGLLGISPEQTVGSQARAKKSFDMFMFIVDKIRMDVEEPIMHDQVIKPLVDFNYNVEDYPRFKLLPLTDEVRTDILDAWAKQVQVKSVSSTDDDEAHIRKLLEFPEFDPEKRREEEPDEDDEEDPDDMDPEGMPFTYRQKTRVERRVNFRQIETFLNEREASAVNRLREEVRKFRTRLVKKARRDVSLDMIKSVERTGFQTAFKRTLSEHLIDTLTRGRRELRREVTGSREMQDEGPNFVPKAALAWIRERAAEKARALDQEVKAAAKLALSKSVELGEGGTAAQQRLDEAFEPFIGDPRVGPTATTPEGGPLPKRRMENIVRTESTTAFNKGRLVEARQPDIVDRMKGMQYSAILDSRTTPVCQHLDGRVFRMGDPALDRLAPPNHFQCRSVLVPVTMADPVEDDEFITPSQSGRGEELALEGFT